ncbi:hypothetical protein KY289_037515 [Solanum tuberosum]|nr:hypothetical protein KY289_037515 [Solanum tuberosum]
MAQSDIDDVLDHLRRIKSGGHLNSVRIAEIETLEMDLRFLRTFLKYDHVLGPDPLVKIKKKAKLIMEMLVFGGVPDECITNINVERQVSQLQEFIEGNTSSGLNYELDDTYLLEYMDYLDKNLIDAPRYLVKSDPFLIKEIKILEKTDRYLRQLIFIQKKMRFLRYLYGTEINGYIDHEKLKGLQTRIQFMAENVGQYCLALWVCEDENDTYNIESKPPYLLFLVALVEQEMKKIFLGELKTSKYAKSRTFKEKKLPKGLSHHLHSLLMYLRQTKLKNFVSSRKIDVAIEFLLVFLGDVPNHIINGKRLNEVLAKIGVLVDDILCVIQMLLAGSTIKEDASKIDLCMIHISEKIEDLKAQVEERYKSLTYSPSNEFPTVGGLSFLDSLLRKLNEMLKSESSLDFMMKPHICILEEDLSYLTSVFRNVAKVQHKHDEILKDLQRRTVNLAYEVEISIDSILVQYNALWHLFCSLPAIIKEIKHICVEVMEMRLKNLPLKHFSVVESSKHLPTQHSNPVNNEEMVSFVNEAEKLIDYLTRGTRELDVIPIVGMGGQGKTTIARKLYNTDIIVSHFDVRAWCIVTQTYHRRELLQVIFSQVTGSKDMGDKDDELADMLRKRLMGKRYLIVLDDMWDCMSWDDLRLCFPDVGNRSRIVVTTRLEKVGEQVKYRTDPYSLPFLTTEESCKLLQKKVFQKEDFPCELQVVSQAVAEKCKGLPLVVILVAGIIKKRKMEESWWHELSYDNLTDCLKPCLLYMGMFLEDAIIPASKLIRLWIAEDFVQNIESGRLMEEAAEGYLMELISSNVVMVSDREYNGKVKYCQVSEVRLLKVLDLSSCRVRALSSVTLKPLIHLKHVDIGTAEFDLKWENNKQGMFEESSKLENLRILRRVRIDEGDRVDVLLRRCPNLQQLDIVLVVDDDSAEICLKLESLTQLQIIRLSFIMKIHVETLTPFIAGLPSLEYLELSALLQFRRKFRPVEEWCLEGITFHKLKFLELVHLAISRWDASDESFPLLETLVLSKCYKLEEIPLSFADILTLKQIKLIWCENKSLEASAVRIKEEVKDIEGCDRIDLIIINPKQLVNQACICNCLHNCRHWKLIYLMLVSHQLWDQVVIWKALLEAKWRRHF